MPFEPRVSVVIPIIRITDRVRTCLDLLARQTYRNFDVFLVSDEVTALQIDGLDLRCIAAGPVGPNPKRREAALISDAELIALIDDDAYPPPEWLATAVRHFTGDVVAAGGPSVTPPADDERRRASGAVYASPFVSAGEARRYAAAPPCDVSFLPTCNLVVRRSALIDAARAGSPFIGGEDLALCDALRRHGRIRYDPETFVYHHRRPLFAPHLRQVWGYAIHRGYLVKHAPAVARDVRFYLPTLFVAGNLAAALAAWAPPAVRRALAVLATAYGGLLAVEALRSARRHDAAPMMIALGIYLTHLTYGIGFLSGLMRRELDH
jgi:GT2 family glycosyltransferase